MAARKYNKGDTVSFIGGKTGKTIYCEVDGYATNGYVAVIVKETGKFGSVPESKLTLVEKAQPKPVTKNAARQVYLWVCLECGKKYNGARCPLCESDERIKNTDERDMDMSDLAGGGYAEPYSPGK